ncbi:MAG: class I adenylate-forming enzyme family protein [Jatrophihabitantaceae bacterium]
MIELLRSGAGNPRSGPAVIGDTCEIDYPRLTGLAQSAAAWLAAERVARFAIADIDADTVIALLAAASLSGAEACVYPPEDAGALQRLAQRFDHELVISTRDDLTGFGAVVDPATVFATDGPVPQRVPDARPHLVLTTGTTGAPRGVRHDWSRLLRRFAGTEAAPVQRWLLCYGLHQFAGLQVILHVMAVQAVLVAPAPRRPREGLAAMRRHGVTHASATPTYWRFLLAESRSGGGALPDLQQLTLGGEAVPDALLAQLRSAFPTAKISHVYAANEIGSTGSVRDGRSGIPIDLLDRDDAEVCMKVVDGQLFVRSRNGMLGYYGEPDVDADAWRATSDVVEVVAGRVLFRGRSSDIVNVGGVKVHPLPVEERIAEIGGVELVRVYGRPNPLTGYIVAAEIVPAAGADTDALADAVRDACADLPAAARPRSIKFVERLATAGGKIARRSVDE